MSQLTYAHLQHLALNAGKSLAAMTHYDSQKLVMLLQWLLLHQKVGVIGAQTTKLSEPLYESFLQEPEILQQRNPQPDLPLDPPLDRQQDHPEFSHNNQSFLDQKFRKTGHVFQEWLPPTTVSERGWMSWWRHKTRSLSFEEVTVLTWVLMIGRSIFRTDMFPILSMLHSVTGKFQEKEAKSTPSSSQRISKFPFNTEKSSPF